jgi:hypothetical protein
MIEARPRPAVRRPDPARIVRPRWPRARRYEIVCGRMSIRPHQGGSAGGFGAATLNRRALRSDLRSRAYVHTPPPALLGGRFRRSRPKRPGPPIRRRSRAHVPPPRPGRGRAASGRRSRTTGALSRLAPAPPRIDRPPSLNAPHPGAPQAVHGARFNAHRLRGPPPCTTSIGRYDQGPAPARAPSASRAVYKRGCRR